MATQWGGGDLYERLKIGVAPSGPWLGGVVSMGLLNEAVSVVLIVLAGIMAIISIPATICCGGPLAILAAIVGD